MSQKILILDDDSDFNSLLTDIFEQADYDVTSLTDPEKALESFKANTYDLVVTDHKMPEMTGAEFMKLIKKDKPEVPVIMVSGYLENETIRELIRDGVGGVFLKPLNIFSLLERTSELIEECAQEEAPVEPSDAGEAVVEESDASEISFRSYPCLSGASVAFAERISNVANFESTLSLIGESGIHYRTICEDIRLLGESEDDEFIYLSSGSFSPEQTLSLIQQVEDKGAKRVTCVILDSEKMNDAQKVTATELAKRTGAFEGMSLRTIFCVNGDLDSLFDAGMIDENLYILMGTAEVTVPPLRKCDADIEVMAQQLVASAAQKRAWPSIPRIDRAARDLLRKQPWAGNFKELSDTVDRIIAANPGASIEHSDVREALKVEPAADIRSLLKTHLSGEQVDLVRAALILSESDVDEVAAVLGAQAESIQPLVN